MLRVHFRLLAEKVQSADAVHIDAAIVVFFGIHDPLGHPPLDVSPAILGGIGRVTRLSADIDS